MAGAAGPTTVPKAKRGLLDLRQEAFDEEIALNGEWEFYWQRLLGPDDRVGKPRVLVEFPFVGKGHVLNGKRLPGFGYAKL